MNELLAIFRRELGGYFATPLAFIFIVIFLFTMGAFTFYLGGYYESGQADLTIFFNFHPWLYLFLIPAISMRLWAEERRSGSDNGVILAGYLGSFFMAGGYLAIGSCLSAVTRNQVIAFVVSVAVCFLFTVSGLPIVIDFFSGWAPQQMLGTIASFSFLTHFNAITRGVIDLRDIIYFTTLIGAWLIACGIVVDMKKAG